MPTDLRYDLDYLKNEWERMGLGLGLDYEFSKAN